MKVVTPAGEKYRVRRKWLPWRRKAKTDALDWLNMPDLGDDPISMIIMAIIMVPLVVILVIFLGEFLLLLLIFPLVMIARAIFGKPWTIEVTEKGNLRAAEQIKGWSASHDRIQEIAKLLRTGGLPALYQAQPQATASPGDRQS